MLSTGPASRYPFAEWECQASKEWNIPASCSYSLARIIHEGSSQNRSNAFLVKRISYLAWDEDKRFLPVLRFTNDASRARAAYPRLQQKRHE
jgi:hypothetical protein